MVNEQVDHRTQRFEGVDAFIDAFADFLDESPTSYHACAQAATLLTDAGFVMLDERDPWPAIPSRGFVVRDGAFAAWRLPAVLATDPAFRVVGAHTDSPGFKLKPRPSATRYGWQQAGMEVYGGPLLNSWLDREMGLAGRLVTFDGTATLVKTGPWLRIPQLAPHLDRSVNESLHLDKQAHLMPVYSIGRPDLDIVTMLCDQANLDPAELAYFDILGYATQPAARFGATNEFLAGPHMDNLSSVFAGLRALIDAPDGPDVMVLIGNDHEEVGSGTRSGAQGPLLESVLARVQDALGLDDDAKRAMIARSTCISSDAGHGVHPNYVTMHDPNHHPLINGGPLLKINASQRYATDGIGAAAFMRACRTAGVPVQPFVSNNSVPCGTTIGPLTATRIGMTTVDVGIGLLSMHSAREMCGVTDPGYLAAALQAFYAGA